MKKICGLLAAFLLSVSLAGSNVLASNKTSNKTELKGKIGRAAPETVNTPFEVKEVKVLIIKEEMTSKTNKEFTNKLKEELFANKKLAGIKSNAKLVKEYFAKNGQHWEQKHNLC